MDFLTWIIVISIVIYVLKGIEHRQRVRLLSAHLAHTQIEKRMGVLIEGYMRALEEKDPQRRQQVWALLSHDEKILADQLDRFADSFASEDTRDTRVSTLPIALPFFDRLFPAYTFDLRDALKLHAQAVRASCTSEDASEAEHKQKAYAMTAELLLLQHTCHWFCKTRTVASMRLLARQKTSYEQVLKSIAPTTLSAYQRLIGRVR